MGCGDRSSCDLRQELGLKEAEGRMAGEAGQGTGWSRQRGGRPRPVDSAAPGNRAAHTAPSGGPVVQ